MGVSVVFGKKFWNKLREEVEEKNIAKIEKDVSCTFDIPLTTSFEHFRMGRRKTSF